MNKGFLTSMGFPLSVASPSIGCFILERNIAREQQEQRCPTSKDSPGAESEPFNWGTVIQCLNRVVLVTMITNCQMTVSKKNTQNNDLGS